MISLSICMRDGSRYPDAHQYEKLEDGFRRALDLADRIGRDEQADTSTQRIDVLQHGERVISVAVIAGGLLPSA
jgi:hypothetical protein